MKPHINFEGFYNISSKNENSDREYQQILGINPVDNGEQDVGYVEIDGDKISGESFQNAERIGYENDSET